MSIIGYIDHDYWKRKTLDTAKVQCWIRTDKLPEDQGDQEILVEENRRQRWLVHCHGRCEFGCSVTQLTDSDMPGFVPSRPDLLVCRWTRSTCPTIKKRKLYDHFRRLNSYPFPGHLFV